MLAALAQRNGEPGFMAAPRAGAAAAQRILFDLRLPATAGVAAALAFAAFGLRVYRTLHATAFDLAFFDQILWNTANGRWFQTTYVPYNFLGQHFEPLLLLPAALYRIGAGPQLLIVAQAAAVGLAALPLYIAGKRLLGGAPALLFALAFLLSPTLQRGVDFGFHPDLFEPLLAFAALAALLAGRRAGVIGCIAVLLLIKEDAFLVALALGWIALLRGQRRFGLAIMAASIAWGAVVLSLLMPLFRGGAAGDLSARYGYLAHAHAGAFAIAGVAVAHADRVFSHLLAPGPETAVLGLLATLVFLPLFAPEVLVAAAPAALVGLLSTHPQQQALDLQYGAPVLTIAVMVALIGAARLRGWLVRLVRSGALPDSAPGRATLAIGVVALTGAAIGAYVRGPYPLERGADAARFTDDGQAAALARITRLIPAYAALSVQTGLAPHLSQRRVQWEFPRLEGAAYVVVQDGGIRSSQSDRGYKEMLASLPARGYGEIAHEGHIRLFFSPAANAAQEGKP